MKAKGQGTRHFPSTSRLALNEHSSILVDEDGSGDFAFNVRTLYEIERPHESL